MEIREVVAPNSPGVGNGTMFSTISSWRRPLVIGAVMLAGGLAPPTMFHRLDPLANAATIHDRSAEIGALEALRAQDLRVGTIAFRLTTAGKDLCDRQTPQLGFVLHDADQYSLSLRDLAVMHFRLREGPSVSAVIPGGPAAAAGLQADDALIAINGAKLTRTGATGEANYAGMAAAMEALNGALARGPVRLTVSRGDRTFYVNVMPVSGCSSEVQLIPSGRMNAEADGYYVEITSAIVDFVTSDDELAAIIGHELAHNILDHRKKLKAAGVGAGLFSKFGRNAARIRATEIEADRLGLYLVARGGYDIEAAPAFWRRFGREHGLGIFADATHPGWRKREAMFWDVIAEIREGK